MLHIINNLASGGAEKLLEELTPIMNQFRDVEAEILLLTDKNNVFYESVIKKGVNVKIAKYNSIYDPRNIFEMHRYIKEGKYDIVHSHLFPTQYWVAISRLFYKNQKMKFITTEHNTYNRRRKWFFFRPIDKCIYSKYDLIISISEKTKYNLIEWIDPKQESVDKHIVIENGIDLESIENALAYNKDEIIKSLDSDAKLVCMVGRFTEQKDQPTLIKAISKLPDNVHLILIGEGELKNINENLAKKLSVSHRVHFLGFRPDVPQILKTIDIVVLSSHWEGFGLTAVEGMAAVKPVIASKVDGLSEVVNEYGLIFEEGNENELASLIERLTEDEQFYTETAQSCKERSKDFSIQKTVDSLLNVYRRV